MAAEKDHFCLIWNNFQNSILSALGSLQSSQDLVDVTLMCEGKNVRAHKVILSACSPYFRNLFKETPCQHPVIILKDVSHYDLTALLQFMYQGEVLITQECLSSFLKTAELLQISGLAGAGAGAPSVAECITPPTVGKTDTESNPPDSPRTVINKLNSDLSLTKPKIKEKELVENPYVDDVDGLQSCSYQPLIDTPVTVSIKTESMDRDYDDMDTETSDMKHNDDNYDNTSTHSEEPSILERSLLKSHGEMDLKIISVRSLKRRRQRKTSNIRPKYKNKPPLDPNVTKVVRKRNVNLDARIRTAHSRRSDRIRKTTSFPTDPPKIIMCLRCYRTFCFKNNLKRHQVKCKGINL